MSGVSSDFYQFCHNESLAGHCLMAPALWLEKTVSHIVSPLPNECCDLIVSLISRAALTVIALLAAIPIALVTVCFSLPGKAIASSCFTKKPASEATVTEEEQSQEEEEEAVSVSIAADPKLENEDSEKTEDTVPQRAKPTESHESSEDFNDISEKSSDEERPSEAQTALFPQLERELSMKDAFEGVHSLGEAKAPRLDDQKNRDYTAVTVPANGNCAFVAFMQEMERLGHPIGIATMSDFRIQTSDWIKANQPNRDLSQLALESVEEYLEVKLQWKNLTQEQLQLMPKINKKMGEDELKAADIELASLAEEKETLSLNLTRVKLAAAIEEIQDLFDDYLEAIKSDTDTERIYASRAHYYAWSRMFSVPVNIEVYIERPWQYNLICKTEAAQETALTVRFLHKNRDHIDILIKN